MACEYKFTATVNFSDMINKSVWMSNRIYNLNLEIEIKDVKVGPKVRHGPWGFTRGAQENGCEEALESDQYALF